MSQTQFFHFFTIKTGLNFSTPAFSSLDCLARFRSLFSLSDLIGSVNLVREFDIKIFFFLLDSAILMASNSQKDSPAGELCFLADYYFVVLDVYICEFL